MAVTINDVAKKAGVSITTVSRVLNNNYPVKKETRIIVEKVIEELNYKPNAMARSLITKKTSMIGVVVPGITNLFFPTIVEAFENEVRNSGYSISLCNTFGDPEEEKMLMENLISRQIDGMLIIDPTYENLKNKTLDSISQEVPTIIINGSGEGAESNFISYDERVGTKEALEYLLKLNHKNIVFIRGARSYSYDIKQKVYDKIIEDNNIEYSNILSVSDGNSIKVVEIVEEEVTKIFENEIKPTAFFACNELMALGAINACNNLGLKIPDDISIISCDNTILSKITSPKLTTIDLKIKDIGQKAATNLIHIIETQFKGKRKINLDTELIIRDSCKEI
ncbi:LacI family DNA-binding transcriptional regulator [Clostridium grantii]|uniref:Transcriptional regulator, LacI family n=1 Tax=Clostridium grantii DSM 8605 TaxID=1121316 RepID=A0A1M5XD97_9CLOT|nr:LacI family DNA-binding transcriptional regulator [Clostridium grantii]SHH97528.1 transcriptional regulator, LacI family [Clostridium grantii DSM 8605]